MIQKLLVCLLAAAIIFMGCATGGNQTRDIPEQVEKPAYITRIENIAIEHFGVEIEIVEWRDNDITLWLFIDNKTMPGSCDYVVVYGIEDRSKDEYEFLIQFTEKDSADPCSLARYAHDKYIKGLDKAKADRVFLDKLKRGI
jgi:hypothetical protein